MWSQAGEVQLGVSDTLESTRYTDMALMDAPLTARSSTCPLKEKGGHPLTREMPLRMVKAPQFASVKPSSPKISPLSVNNSETRP